HRRARRGRRHAARRAAGRAAPAPARVWAAGAAARGSACTAAVAHGPRARAGPYICEMTPAEAAVGRLVVCPTPIGNLEDVTPRVLAALAAADLVACDDT